MKTKELIESVIVVSFMMIMGMFILNRIDNIQQEQEQKEIKQYTQCIKEQSKQHGYIIRSNCSSNYEYLDEKANLHYKQINKDLYLK